MLTRNTNADSTLFDLLDQCVKDARIRFILPDRTVDVGRSVLPPDQADVVVRVTDPGFSTRILTSGNLGLGESWLEGGWTIEHGSLEGLLAVLARSKADEKLLENPKVLMRVAAMRIQHMFTGARANIHQHYDIGEDVYEIFLDETRAYTCPYQKDPGESLQQIQENKFDRICQKLQLKPGETLFDIGCGFGGLMIHAAKHYGVKARGITLSKVQAEGGMRRVHALGLQDRVTVDFGDYREAKGVYDKVVSVGMFEHLYEHQHPVYFDHISRLLAEDGIGLVHTMGCVTDKNANDPFTQKYFFPGSTHPRLSSMVRQLEKQKLAVMDVENIARHYLAATTKWLANFRAGQNRLDPAKYDTRFLKSLEYLLALYVAASDALVGAVFQVLFTKNYRRNLPLIRV